MDVMAPGHAATYYKPSGKFSIGGLALALAIGLVGSLVLGFVYAYIVAYIPIAGYITFVFALGFGALVGLIVGKAVQWGKVRNTGVALLAVAVATLFGYYVSWAAWLHAILNRADFPVELSEILFAPDQMWFAISIINEVGSFSIKGWTPTGGVLWGLWLIEAGLIIAPALLIGFGQARGVPFCESCENWCEETEAVALLDAYRDSSAAIRAELEAHNLEYLETLGPPTEDNVFYRINLCHCAHCKQTNTLTMQRVTINIDRDGDASTSTDDLVTEMLISAEQVAWIRDLGARVASMPREPSGDIASSD